VIRRRWFPALLWLALAVTVTFLTLPVVAIFVHTSPGALIASLGHRQSLDALRLSLITSSIAIATILLIGTPAAYALATRPFRGSSVLLTLIELPLVLPPAVAGIGLLVALGPDGLLGGTLADLHIQLVPQTAGVVVALVFVSAPFYLSQAHAAFQAIERTHIEAALALGASKPGIMMRIAIPIARRGLVAGTALAWGRALGEFGATLLFAGSFEGVTQTAPLAIYDDLATDLPAALALSAILIAASAALLLTVRLVFARPQPRV
jgi:molybdate transport system permease protein